MGKEIAVVPVIKKHKPEDMYDIAWEETRYVIQDAETGEVLDDAQGYGFKTKQKAYAAWAYKTRDPIKTAQKKEKEHAIRHWMKEHKSFCRDMEQFAFEIAKGSWGPNDKFDAKFVGKMLKESGYTDLPFTPGELLKVWRGR